MKLLKGSPFFVAVASAFEPTRIAYQDLINGSIDLKQPLSKVGMVSLTGLPFSGAFESMLKLQHECLVESPMALKTEFSDGTTRLTLATHNTPGSGLPGIGTDCSDFESAATQVRQAVSNAVSAFAEQITDMIQAETPLLQANNGFFFDTFRDVVEYGEALEHFHSYTRFGSSLVDNESPTIDLHTDQGLLLAFTPGRIGVTGQLAKGFFIETDKGEIEEVQFNKDDNLVLLLGDGVNQYVNDKAEIKLRSVPHALRILPGEEPRVWYGRMVLPPPHAYHPVYTEYTFGDLRQGLLENDDNSVRLACSQDTTMALYRNLEGTSCNNTDEIFCWHRCMSALEYNASEAICEELSLELKCINPRGQVSTGEFHGDYFPGCVSNDTEFETPFPELPGSPRNEDECTDFAAYVAQEEYENSIELNDGDGAVFQWTLKGDVVDARLAYNGLFQYLAVGIPNPNDKGLNGMLGAHIVMAKAASEYSASEGLDFTTDPDVQQYIIDLEESAFRHWSTPVVPTNILATDRSSNRRQMTDTLQASFDSTDCFTSLYFTGNSIGLKPLNLTGSDKLIWAANSQDSFMQYHGANRGHFTVDWSQLNTTEAPDGSGQSNSTQAPQEASTATSGRGYMLGSMGVALASMIMAFF